MKVTLQGFKKVSRSKTHRRGVCYKIARLQLYSTSRSLGRASCLTSLASSRVEGGMAATVARVPRRARGAAQRARPWPRGVVAVAAVAVVCGLAFFAARFGLGAHGAHSPRENVEYTSLPSAPLVYLEYHKLSSAPLVYLIRGLLSPDECDELVELGDARMRPSEMGGAGSDPTGDGEASSRRRAQP